MVINGKIGYNLPFLERSTGNITCNNEFVIDKNLRCDGNNDCGDGSDEIKCGML